MSTVGDTLSTVGILSIMEGYHNAFGDIMSTVGGVQYHEGYNLLLFEYFHGNE